VAPTSTNKSSEERSWDGQQALRRRFVQLGSQRAQLVGRTVDTGSHKLGGQQGSTRQGAVATTTSVLLRC
jgi:hypothetical protein